MVEGPLVHQTAEIHRVLLLGKAFAATSPNGRFTEGASAINGRFLSLIEAHGKNIFYFFTRQKLEKAVLANLPDDVVVVHIHFGLTGYFDAFVSPAPEPRGKTRLTLRSEDRTMDAHLTASVCVDGDMELYRKTIAKLGPGPLRADADKELVWEKMQKTRKTVGGILMVQSLVAGIGNLYRSEILFASGLHPNQRASTLPRSAFEKLWEESKRLFRLGLLTQITVCPEEISKPYHEELKTEDKFYAYRQSICKVCRGAIRTWPSAGRNVYACEVCQPLRTTNERIVDKSLVEDASIGKREAIEPQSGLISTEDYLSTEVSDSPGGRTSSYLDPKTRIKSVSDFRTRRVLADKTMQHQPFMNISTGGLRNFSSTLADSTDSTRSKYDSSALRKGALRNGASERAVPPRKYHSQTSQFEQVLHERESWSPWQTFTNQCIQTRRVRHVTLRVLRTVKPQARIGLQAVSTLCLGSSSLVLMLSTRLPNALPLSNA